MQSTGAFRKKTSEILTYYAYIESIHRMLTLNAYASIHFLPSIKKHDLSASILLSLWVAISLNFFTSNQDQLWNITIIKYLHITHT